MKKKFFTILSVAFLGLSISLSSCDGKGSKGGGRDRDRDDDDKPVQKDSNKAQDTAKDHNPINAVTPAAWSPKTEAEYKAMTTDQLLDELQAFCDFGIAEMQATQKQLSPETQAQLEPLAKELDSRTFTPEQTARFEAMGKATMEQTEKLKAQFGISDNDTQTSGYSYDKVKSMSNEELISEFEFVMNQALTFRRANPYGSLDPDIEDYGDFIVEELDKRNLTPAQEQRAERIANNFQMQAEELRNSLRYDYDDDYDYDFDF